MPDDYGPYGSGIEGYIHYMMAIEETENNGADNEGLSEEEDLEYKSRPEEKTGRSANAPSGNGCATFITAVLAGIILYLFIRFG